MAKFEYLCINLNTYPPGSDDIELLNDAGRQGWWLVCITANKSAYLIREIAEPPQRRKRREASS